MSPNDTEAPKGSGRGGGDAIARSAGCSTARNRRQPNRLTPACRLPAAGRATPPMIRWRRRRGEDVLKGDTPIPCLAGGQSLPLGPFASRSATSVRGLGFCPHIVTSVLSLAIWTCWMPPPKSR